MENFPPTALFDAFLNPEQWGELSLITWVTGLFGVAAVATIIVGSFFGLGELATTAGIAAVVITYIVPMYSVYQHIHAISQLPAGVADWVAMIAVSPVILALVFLIIEWWTNRT
jgi:hypothetical protein